MKIKVRSKENASIFNDKPSSDNILRVQKCSGNKPVKVYRLQNHSAFRGKFKVKHNSFSYSSGGGLEGASNWSRSIPSAIQVAAPMKVSMKDWKSYFLLLSTLRDASLSSRASLQLGVGILTEDQTTEPNKPGSKPKRPKPKVLVLVRSACSKNRN